MFRDEEWQRLCDAFVAADRDVRQAWAVIEARLGRIDDDQADAAGDIEAAFEAELSILELAKSRRDDIDQRMTAFKRQHFVDSGYGELGLSIPTRHRDVSHAHRA